MGAYPSHYNPPYNTGYAGYNSSVPNLPYQPYAANQGGYGYDPERDDPFAPPYDADGKPPGYGTAGDYKGEDKNKDPFGDSDGPSSREERDVTSRPEPGGGERFH